MPDAKPQWVFTRTANRTWAWRRMAVKGNGNAFISLDQAAADALKHGFDPFTQSWIARIDGRTTHYRPGKATVNLKADETPPE
jgi:hypothetical protein